VVLSGWGFEAVNWSECTRIWENEVFMVKLLMWFDWFLGYCRMFTDFGGGEVG
jgi:hypothetical protein